MNKLPKISVIIPAYNRAKFLSKTIESVLNQTFKDFELIIVDDGSTDNTKKIIEDFIKKDDRIKYLYQENSGGPSRPKNTGFKHAKGKYVAFLDHDDEWLPEKLAKQYELFEKSPNNIGLITCHALIVNEQSSEVKIRPAQKVESIEDLILKDNSFPYSCSSIMVRKKAMEDISGFDENLKIADDLDFYVRMTQQGYSFDFVPEPLFRYVVHDNNISGDKLKSYKDYYEMVKKHEKLFQGNNKILSVYYRRLGTYTLFSGDTKEAKKLLKKSLKLDFNIRNLAQFIILSLNKNLYLKILELKSK